MVKFGKKKDFTDWRFNIFILKDFSTPKNQNFTQ